MEKLSKVFYKVSVILSIIMICFLVIGMAIYGGVMGYAIGAGKFPEASTDAKVMVLAVAIALLVVYEVLMGWLLAFSIANLVVAKKAQINFSRPLHIASIVLGALSGMSFSIAAGILGLIVLSKKGE